jgi:hypothetical protein
LSIFQFKTILYVLCNIMSEFICIKCKKKFTRAYNLKRHIERKIPCKEVEEKKTYQNIPTTQKNIPKHTKTYQTTQKKHTKTYQNIPGGYENEISSVITQKNEQMKFSCQYCQKSFSTKNSLYRHINELRCQSMPDEKILEIKRKSKNKVIQTKKNQIVERAHNNHNVFNHFFKGNDDSNMGSNIFNNIGHLSNTNNTNNITHYNNVNHIENVNQINIKINPFGKENISFLTKEDKLRILERVYNGVPELIKTIHSHPENRNIFLPNVNKNVIAYLNDNNEIQYENKTDICQQLIDDNIERIDEFFNEFKNDIKSTMKERIGKMIDKSQEDINQEKYIKDINLFLMNISKKHKNDLNNYLDELECKYNE